MSTRILRTSRALALALALAAASVLAAAACAAEELAPSVSPQELERLLASADAPLLLDVRTPEEFRAGHIPGARNVPYEEVAARASELSSPDGVAVYCMKGPRARIGERALLEAGVPRVLHLEGGYSAWHAAGLPVEK